MGYEIRLIIGRECSHPERKMLRKDKPEIDGNSLYYPHLEDSEGNIKYSDIMQTYFQVYATIDLCKIGGCNLKDLLKVNKNDKEEYFWYGEDGNTQIIEDCYGDKPQLASIDECINALEKDVKDSNYRRFKWALSLLKSMNENSNAELSILWYGH